MAVEEQVKTSENKPERDEKGQLLPGNTANPNGRPKGSFSLLSILKEKLQEVPKDQQKTRAVELIEKMLDLAIDDGDANQIRNILQYIEGMPKQSVDLDLGAKQSFLEALTEYNGKQRYPDPEEQPEEHSDNSKPSEGTRKE